jgi:hypothetical protein
LVTAPRPDEYLQNNQYCTGGAASEQDAQLPDHAGHHYRYRLGYRHGVGIQWLKTGN